MSITAILRAVGFTFVAFILVACVQDSFEPIPEVTVSPAESSPGADLVELVEAEGYVCSTEPSLTDMIVFESGTMAEVMTFDQAWAAAEAGKGDVFAYCL